MQQASKKIESGLELIIGVSSCLLGNSVRYDGGHKRDRYVTDILSTYMNFYPICPEVECGLSIPRESMRLRGDPDNPRLVGGKSGVDYTDQMQAWCDDKVETLEAMELCGFIFKSKSPSSGMSRVKVYDKNGVPRKNGSGLFARCFMNRYPLIPVEEEGRLHDLRLRENFIESVFVYKRWREVAVKPTAAKLVYFHTSHKYLILAHSEKEYRMMGKLIATAGSENIVSLVDSYGQLLMRSMRVKPTVKKHVNVLQHMLGYFKKALSSDEKQEMITIIDQFKKEFVPLIVPITMINHYVRKYQQTYLAGQYYLNPHPLELKLRNHA